MDLEYKAIKFVQTIYNNKKKEADKFKNQQMFGYPETEIMSTK